MSRVIDMTKPMKEWDADELRYALDRNLLDPEDRAKVSDFLKNHEDVMESDDEPEDDDAFDPKKHSVEDVVAYLTEADGDERARVIAAEEEGKARKGILEFEGL